MPTIWDATKPMQVTVTVTGGRAHLTSDTFTVERRHAGRIISKFDQRSVPDSDWRLTITDPDEFEVRVGEILMEGEYEIALQGSDQGHFHVTFTLESKPA